MLLVSDFLLPWLLIGPQSPNYFTISLTSLMVLSGSSEHLLGMPEARCLREAETVGGEESGEAEVGRQLSFSKPGGGADSVKLFDTAHELDRVHQ